MSAQNERWELGEPAELEDIPYEAVFAAAPVPLLVLSPDLVVREANRAYLRTVGCSRQELVGRFIFDVFPASETPDGNSMDAVRASMERARDTGRPDTMAVQRYDIASPSGELQERYWSPVHVPILDEEGTTILVLHRAEDVTEFVLERQRRAADDATRRTSGADETAEADVFSRARELQEHNAELRQVRDSLAIQVRYDPLTGLLTRPALLEQLSRALTRSPRSPLAVLFVDLDGLKQANDRYGHASGDELLRCFATQLQGVVRPSDPVARFGGDEFVILLENLRQGTDAEAVAGRVLEGARSCSGAPGAQRPSASVGIALTGDLVPSPDELIAQADAAMYRAKQAGGDRYELSLPHASP